MLRAMTLTVVSLVAALWLWTVTVAILTNWGPRENGFATALALAASMPFLTLALPALILALRRKFVVLALALAVMSLLSIALVA